jgi:hypothetical protein
MSLNLFNMLCFTEPKNKGNLIYKNVFTQHFYFYENVSDGILIIIFSLKVKAWNTLADDQVLIFDKFSSMHKLFASMLTGTY